METSPPTAECRGPAAITWGRWGLDQKLPGQWPRSV